MGRLPEGWRTARLDQLCVVNPRAFDVEPMDGEMVSRVPMASVEAGSGILDASGTTPYEMVKGKSLTKFQEGDVVFSKITPCMENGKIAIAVGLEGGRAVGSTEFHVLRTLGAVDAKFLMHFLLQKSVRAEAERNMAGAVGQRRVPKSYLEALEIPVPPLAEQHRIVEAIEEQLSRLNAASAILNRVRLQGSSLQKQMVSAVISGRRRAAGSEGEVDEFLSQVDEQVARVAGKKRWAQIRNPEVSELYEIPAGWRWRTLGSLCLDIQYGTSAKASPKKNVDDIPVIRMGNIQDGRLDLGDLKFLPVSHSDIEKSILQDGDMLFNRTNSAELVGKSAVFRKEMGAAVYASYLIRCRFAEGVDPDWVNTVVNSNFGRRYIASVVTQQVGQANVNSAKMALMPIPVPPPAEQREALKVLRDWESALTRPQLAAGAAVKRTEGLKSAILRRAFNGDLVPQDPADEPAATLLARIVAEREAAKPARKAAKRAARPRKATVAAAATKAAPAPTPAPSASVQQELFDQ
ncbi:restriction endonuclease subunit S [Streptomyces sp. NPDC091385]|uniref:restriction endonuclease subunit S n=1 Tax=Streptomyces sp. NPDC091385 TaxID=3365997 RepID=UPI003818071F